MRRLDRTTNATGPRGGPHRRRARGRRCRLSLPGGRRGRAGIPVSRSGHRRTRPWQRPCALPGRAAHHRAEAGIGGARTQSLELAIVAGGARADRDRVVQRRSAARRPSVRTRGYAPVPDEKRRVGRCIAPGCDGRLAGRRIRSSRCRSDPEATTVVTPAVRRACTSGRCRREGVDGGRGAGHAPAARLGRGRR